MKPASKRVTWVAVAVSLGAVGCSPADFFAGSVAAAEGRNHRQTAFRVRADLAAGLDEDEGWAGALNENVTVRAEQPFRLRFELERFACTDIDAEAAPGPGAATDAHAAADGNGCSHPRATANTPFRLQYRRNGAQWTDVQAADFPYPADATPRVSIVSTPAYDDGEPTSDLLPGSDARYTGGAGIDLADRSPQRPARDGHSEWEWPLVIRRFADGALMNEDGDRFEFRMTDAEGHPVEAHNRPTLTLSVPPRLLAGTFVETPARIGPWQASNGDLYFIMEPAETDNVLMVVKSTDGGETWREVDGANRPAIGDLEGLGSDLAGDTIHILHQTSDEVLHHAFRTSDHPARPDTWAIRDDVVAAPPEPPVQVATITARSDGSLVAIYGGPDRIHAQIRSVNGGWGREIPIDADVPPELSGPQAVLGDGDEVHLAYTGRDGTAWYRRILPDGSLTPRERIADGLGRSESDIGSILPLVFMPETNTAVIVYRVASGELWERRIIAAGPPTDPVRVTERKVAQNAVDSDQVGADAIVHDGTVHVLFIEESSGSIYHTQTGTDGAWLPATLRIDGVRAQWIRGARLELLDGTDVYGYVYDAGSNGGSGTNWIAHAPLSGR